MTPRAALLVYGAGGHGLVVAEAAHLGGFNVLGFIDDGVPPGVAVGAWAVLGGGEMADELASAHDAAVIVAIGDNRLRWEAANRVVNRGLRLATVIHPSAQVSPSARLDPGVFIGPLAVVHAEARVEHSAIVNSSAVVEHHVGLGAAAHIAPGAVLAGRAAAGARTLIGAGAVVLPGVRVGTGAVVGAGAVVLHDVPDETKVVGNPARALPRRPI